MKTIALVTMLFPPATFVSSFLGTNLVALEVGADGRTRFVVSHLWWIYLVSAVPLTMATLLAWLYFVKRRSRKERAKVAANRRGQCLTLRGSLHVASGARR